MERASTFASLRIRSYRLYWICQVISQVGTWLSLTAVSWLVLTELHGGGSAIGLVTAAQFFPTLVLGSWAGVVADRRDVRRLLLVTQTGLLVAAGFMALLVLGGWIRLWMVFPLVAMQGAISAFDNPARQTFVSELVGPDLISNGIALNSAGMNCARIIGPALAGGLIALSGTGLCIALNAGSFLFALGALVAIRTADLHPRARVTRAKGQVREGLRYASQTPVLRATLITMAVVGTVSMNFTVLVPLLARTTFVTSAGTFGLLSTGMGVGSLIGSLLMARRGAPGLTNLAVAALALAIGMTATAAAPTLLVALATITFTGACFITFLTTTNTILQQAARPELRGRVLSLYLVLLIGTSPFGSPIVGAIAERWGTRTSFLYGASGAVVGALIAYRGARRLAVDEDAPVLEPAVV